MAKQGIEPVVHDFLRMAVEKGASDLHLGVTRPPTLRIDGKLEKTDFAPISPQEMEAIFESISTPEQRNTFYSELELDFTYSFPGVARFRVNVLRQRGTLSLAFRLVPFQVASLDELGLPAVCKKIALRPRGLVLLTGPTGSGKSTTMAAMVDHLNENEGRNIIIIEDPIEYLHRDKNSIIVQRDLGDDTRSFANALKFALRHDPDVIVVGEMRDLETIALAISAAETGHLVFSTLHTTDAPQTVDRVIEVFPSSQQQQIRMQFSQVIEAVISQVLLPRASGGRIVACEIMTAIPAIRNLIRDGKTYQLSSIIHLSGKEGMQTLEQALAELVVKHEVTLEDALARSSSPEQVKKMFEQGRGRQGQPEMASKQSE